MILLSQNLGHELYFRTQPYKWRIVWGKHWCTGNYHCWFYYIKKFTMWIVFSYSALQMKNRLVKSIHIIIIAGSLEVKSAQSLNLMYETIFGADGGDPK